MANPIVMITTREEALAREVRSMRSTLDARLDRAGVQISSLASQVRALSPASTLQRGYAVLRTSDGAVVRDSADVARDQPLEAVVAHGRFAVAVTDIHSRPGAPSGPDSD